jgi:hypothetical protein
MKKSILVALAATFSLTAFAADVPKWELTGDYSYLQYNTTITGFQSRAFNGGGGQIQYNFGNHFGVKGDFQGYGSTQWTLNVTSPIPTPNGIIPVGTYKSNANMFTYMFGPVVGVHANRFNVFAEVLFGGANSNGYATLYNQAITGGSSSTSGTQHPFTMEFGGGLDLNAGKHLAFRLAELDYLLTRFTNPFTQTNNQNNFRYLGGVVFKFGEK